MRILFWGTTPGFALPALEALADAGHEIAGVVTRPERPRGRGLRVAPSAVRRFAEARGCPVLAPERPHGPDFEEAVRAVAPDLSVVVAYGCILKQSVLDLPPLGSFNVHASLLPALRGAAPVTWAIARGHPATGVTVQRMVRAMDAGPILAQKETAIGPRETMTELSERLAEVGARLLTEVLAAMADGPAPEVEQDHDAATYAPRVSRDTARIDWGAEAGVVADLMRAMDRTPGAWSRMRGAPVKLFRPRAAPGEGGEPGVVVRADPRAGLEVAAGRGVVRVGEVQPAGKRRMDAAAWLRGAGPAAGDRFE